MYSKNEMKEHIQESVDHWEKNIIGKFKEGLLPTTDYQWSDGQDISDGGENCPLCRKYFKNGDCAEAACGTCPYTLYYGEVCDKEYSGFWYKWEDHRSIETATAMRDALVEILDNLDSVYDKYSSRQ